ncbi:MAG TPA: site-2 protease family protein [Verrucomicrobiae bacterium]|nr:site-2 protease family protein [Verrucomicrobiae bacterium]
MSVDYSAANNVAPELAMRHRDVLLELEKSGQKQSGATKGILLLIVSLIAFVAIGFAQWSSWEALVILVGVLFVHELGHFLAMRVFKYRNLRMFFIPFFGAAVIGHNYNVAGWKKVIVSLMGPVPGIVLGGGIGITGLALHNALLIKIGLMAVIINGFNLLPVLPLDGGWVAHAILFSRHHMLDCAFRVFAVLGLLALAIVTQTRILMYVAIPMVLGIGAAYKLNRISRDLKERDLPKASPDDQTIPPETAIAIIDAVRDELPNAQTPKAAAQHTLQVFETLNARPPGWLASTVLLMTHGVAFLLAVVLAVLFVVGQRGNLGDFIVAAATGPKQILKTDTLSRVVYGDAAREFSGPKITVIGECPRDQAAARAFDALAARVPSTGALRRFGNTILVSLPDGNDNLREQWVHDLQRHATNVLVASTNFFASLTLSCVAMSDSNAVSLHDDAQAYFAGGPDLLLKAPWDPLDRRSPTDKQQHQIARQTYMKLMQTGADGYSSSEALALRKRLGSAVKHGDRVLARTLEEDARTLAKELKERSIKKLRDQGPANVDLEVIDLYSSLPENYWTNQEAKLIFRQMGAKMGQLPLQEGKANARARQFSASGAVDRNGLLLTFHWLFFQDIFEGAPALAKWLDSQGCKDIRYQFNGGSGEDEDHDE